MTDTEKTSGTDLNGQHDLSNGVIVVLSGGPFDWTNPIEVRERMDALIAEVNADPYVLANTGGQGLTFRLLPDQQNNHIHQSRWRDVLKSLKGRIASPLILIGHSNGGAAVIDLARSLRDLGKPVDFAFTADSVLTLDDDGDVYKVPQNVTLNLNSYSIPILPIWGVLPFPHGQQNSREADNSLDGILNIGLPLPEPGAIEHRDVFYDLAGGSQTSANGYMYPELIRDTSLAVLKGASNGEVFQLAQSYLQVLANEVRVPIELQSADINTTLQPAGAVAVKDVTSRFSESTHADVHKLMADLERIRLSMG